MGWLADSLQPEKLAESPEEMTAGKALFRKEKSDPEVRKMPPRYKQEDLGPRISKLSNKEMLKEYANRVSDKPDVGMGLGEADLETTSVEPIAGVAESALTLSSGALTWMFGKAAATPARILGKTDIAEEVEGAINDLTYKPYTDTGRMVTKGVGDAIDFGLTPVHWWGEKVEQTIIDPLKGDRSYWNEGGGHQRASDRAIAIAESFKWFGELTGELATFHYGTKIAKIPVEAVKKGNFNFAANKAFYADAIKTLEHARDVHQSYVDNPAKAGMKTGRLHRVRQADGTIKEARLENIKDIAKNHEAIVKEKQQAIDVLKESDGDFELALQNLDGWRSTHQAVLDRRIEMADYFEKWEKAKTEQKYADQINEIDAQIYEGQKALTRSIANDGTTGFHKDIIAQYDAVEVQLKRSLKQSQKNPLIKKLLRQDKYGLEMKNLIIDRHGGIQGAEMDSFVFRQGIESRLTIPERHAALFLIEKIPVDTLQRLANEGKIPQETVDIASKPTEAMTKEVANLRKFYKESHEFLTEHHEDVGFHENYVNRVWDLTGKEQKALGNYFTRTNKFMKKRSIPTVADGIDAGYKMQTTDIVELVKIYDSYKIKTSYNNKFAESIFDMVDPEYGRLIDTYKNIPEEYRHEFTKVDYAALKKAAFRGTTKGLKKVTTLEKHGNIWEKSGEAHAMVDTPIIEMQDVYVHKSILPYVKNIFEPKFRNKVLGAIEGVNAVGKKSNLVFSLFHNLALAEGAVGHGILSKGSYRIIKGMMDGKAYAVSSPEMIVRTKRALADGITLDPLKDHHIGKIQRGLDKISTTVSEKNRVVGAPAKALAWANKKFDRVLFDYTHSTLKLMAYERGINIELGKLAKSGELMKMTSGEIKQVRQNIAAFVNDSFGGQLWELNKYIGDAKAQQMMQLALLSPDWTLSTIKQGTKTVAGGGQGVSMFVSGKKGVNLNGMGARFWTRSLIASFITIQGLNLYFSNKIHGKARYTWENPEDRTSYILFGKNEDGQDLYARVGKQFREVPEWVLHPWDKLGGKLSPLLQATSHQFFSASGGSGFPTEWQRKKDQNEALLRAKTLATDLTPFSLRHFITGQPGPIAFSVPVSKGMSKYQAHEQLVEALESGADEGDMNVLRQHVLENGLPYKELLKQAEGTVKRNKNQDAHKLAREIYTKYRQGAGGMNMADLLETEREKSGLTPQEWREVRKKFKRLVKEQRSVARQKRRYDVDQHLNPFRK